MSTMEYKKRIVWKKNSGIVLRAYNRLQVYLANFEKRMEQEMARVIELRSCKNGSITSTISDQEVFDYPIWYQALKVPVSQVCFDRIGVTICNDYIFQSDDIN